ncbi:hypothetical protein [Haloarcula sp. 1CSR25-25]|uniref:DUF7286 family protein n=1 Tax=Haloarcula sp. 1CSR25-25 TaxID=2862545 RepID=UPI0028942F26|nr:hypothetical protein [Haloarcula sp. 1CSR25-25]MDT3436177.1 hypothetical protein [Haloarcula sp. 1CSR25-25]
MVAVRDDTRGRVPFALLGVLLLVSSLTLAPTFVSEPAPSATSVERALNRATAETQVAVRDGVATAGRQAAANPVVTPANTPTSRVLNDSTAFRDSLRVRAYLRVADRLSVVSARSGDVTVSARLPAVTNASDLRAAKHRVSIARAGPNETAMRATVEDVVLTVRRHGTVVSTRRISPTVVVPTQALMLHDQVSTYQTRLNNGLHRSGLSQRMTARLYPMAWARGYAQYGGAGIENVVANRHVSLATNGALLGVQRSTFGRSDPAGRRALTEATAMTGIEDLIRGSRGTAYSSAVLDRAEYRPVSETPPRPKSTAGPGPADSMTVGVNETADTAFRTVTEPSTLNETLRDAYTVEVALEIDEHRVDGGPPGKPSSPGADWTLVTDRTTTSTEAVGNASSGVTAPDGWHALETFGRTVERRYTRTAVWRNGTDRRRTTASSTARYRVAVAVVGRHHGRSPAPNRTIRTAHDAGASPLNGSNLADVGPAATVRLVGDAGGRDRVAERVVDDSLHRTETTVTADRPPGLHGWVYRDLMDLRASVRNTTVTVERGRVGTFETNPPAELGKRLTRRRPRLADVPDTYNSAAQKARVAARLAYLNEVSGELRRQSTARNDTRERVDAQLRERTEGSLRDLRRGLTARETRAPRSRPVPVGPAGPVRTRVDTRTPYLTLAELDGSRYRALDGREHPLVARNVNVFTVPYGNAADAVAGGAFESADRVRLATAANTLAAANETLEGESNATLATERDALQREVREANEAFTAELRQAVHRQATADAEESSAIVSAAKAAWETPESRALALTNGSAHSRVARIAGDRLNLTRVERDRLRLALLAVDTPATRPTRDSTSETAAAVRSVAKAELSNALANAGERTAQQVATNRLGTDKLPAGLPLAPPVTPWYATANVWWVTVEGEYARFGVSASHGPPSDPGARTTYARDGHNVTLDVDDDGVPERLGTADRVSFRAETGIVVVVPPKPRGVGDKDGTAVEESSGWPDAGT